MSNQREESFMALRHLAMITALAVVTGCDTGLLAGVSTVGQVSANYRENMYPIAGLDRDMWVIVAGSVPNSDAPALQRQTLATMQRHAGIKTRFTATPQNYSQEFKTVIVFNGPNPSNGGELCRNASQPGTNTTAAPESELRLQAVFCRYDAPLTEVVGRVGGGNSLGNPNFDALIRQTMTELYRAQRQQQRNEPDEG